MDESRRALADEEADEKIFFDWFGPIRAFLPELRAGFAGQVIDSIGALDAEGRLSHPRWDESLRGLMVETINLLTNAIGRRRDGGEH